MQALILVGGEGTRLRPLTSTLPKPIVPLVDRPFLGFMIEWLVEHGVDDVVLACGFRADSLRATLGDGGGGGPRLTYVEEPEPRGTAGAIKFSERFLADRFVVLNGDVLTDLDLSALLSQHEESGAVATLGLTPVRDPSRYGLVRRTDDGRITDFLEKPAPDQVDTDEISAGIYVLERQVLEMIPEGEEFSIERQVFPRLVGKGLYGCRLEGYWLDIGTPSSYLQATWDILERTVETSVGAKLGESFTLVEDEADVAPDAHVVPPAVIQAGARVAAGARVGPLCVLGHGSEVEAGAEVERSVIHRGCRIGTRAVVRESILASGVEIGDEARIESGTILGEGVRVGPRNQLGHGIRVSPAVTIPAEAIRFGDPADPRSMGRP